MDQYRTIDGKVYRVIPLGKETKDQHAARERAQRAEQKRRKHSEFVRMVTIWAIIILFAAVTAVIWFGW